MFNVAVLTPSTGICRMGYAQCLAKLMLYFCHYQVLSEEQQQIIIPDSIEGSGIGENYERMVEKYLNDKEVHWTHFLSLEDDMSFPPDSLHRLARHRLDVVGANYSTNKGKVQRFTTVGMTGRCITGPDSTGIEEVTLIPQGVTLVRREVYEKIERPYFLTGWDPVHRQIVHQDYYFSQKVREGGFKLYVDHDLSKTIVHTGPKGYTWEDAYNDLPKEKVNGNIA